MTENGKGRKKSKLKKSYASSREWSYKKNIEMECIKKYILFLLYTWWDAMPCKFQQ
jgi:hypothetical protein